MPTPPRKTKPIEAWTVEDHAAHIGDRSHVPVSAEYLAYKADALRAAGLVDEADATEGREPSLEEMSPAEHYERIRRR